MTLRTYKSRVKSGKMKKAQAGVIIMEKGKDAITAINWEKNQELKDE